MRLPDFGTTRAEADDLVFSAPSTPYPFTTNAADAATVCSPPANDGGRRSGLASFVIVVAYYALVRSPTPSDEGARLLKVAEVGLVGDLVKLVPKLTERLLSSAAAITSFA